MQKYKDTSLEALLKALRFLEACLAEAPDGRLKMHINIEYNKLYAIATELRAFDIRLKNPKLTKAKQEETKNSKQKKRRTKGKKKER